MLLKEEVDFKAVEKLQAIEANLIPSSQQLKIANFGNLSNSTNFEKRVCLSVNENYSGKFKNNFQH